MPRRIKKESEKADKERVREGKTFAKVHSNLHTFLYPITGPGCPLRVLLKNPWAFVNCLVKVGIT